MTTISAISHQIWDMKYRLRTAAGDAVDKTIEDTWSRVANALADPENPAMRDEWAEKFAACMADFRFLPAGRIVAGAGTDRDVTLFNCFVMGIIPDDMSGIFEHLREAALTMQQGGGIGYDFSTLRPKDAHVRGVGADASGPLSFMDVWDSMCRTIMSAGHRRGAMMATLRCNHPDIESFIAAKKEAGRLRMFNLSVLVTDDFMDAVREDRDWDLTFNGTTYKTVSARALWDHIMEATYEYAEPGVIFIDRINRANNLGYCETIAATNPCGEQPLPPYGACLLGSINLARLVIDPFELTARLDEDALAELVPVAVRMMDNVTEASLFPLDAQGAEAKAKRRIGLGVTGLADALILCGARYGSAQAVELTERWMLAIRDHAYRASVDLAAEKGAFPLFDADAFLAGETVAALPQDIRDGIREYGIRNALLTSIAPTGTISLFADNVSSGIEPVFSYTYTRTVLMPDGTQREEEVSDYAYRLWRRLKGDAPLPDSFVSAQNIAPGDHVVMQAAAQKYIDSSISKTINVPADLPFDAFKDVYKQAWDTGCKGCTTYRPNDITGSVLQVREHSDPAQPELPLIESTPSTAEDEFESGVVYMTQPLSRPEGLPGQTYKLNWPETDHAMYITINDIVQDGRRRPFEVFVNSKDTEHYAWTVALTRMISAVFRRGGDVSFVVDELKAVFDPRGGQWMQGRYVPSLLAAIGDIIERHMIDIGFLPRPGKAGGSRTVEERKVVGLDDGPRMRQCPKCGQAALLRQEGCDTCTACDFSKCG
ncbi:MAG: adenosylcobalamin-dependent ribonucleoside-diphosphate reductase [Rhodospirillaceae bacterium]|nr:ribonucleoside-diphosphate reductase, adenosylcobalamin-dependent [Rhodospirillaceae bacterium]RPF95832.1 MAG: adenosylcobalamin-dependent ribonucleoside-diphosphate reductase [Rhodospirillaceae bacterium TMED63]RZO38925.1 MAG: adenosylcobalamin-dependent ribonucleoside-diphosphate reductase [Rhodospirillaceae bacterium]